MGLTSLFCRVRNSFKQPSNVVSALQKQIQYKFQNSGLLTTALTHPSALKDHAARMDSYERLEFLGDAILDMIVSEFLYKKHPRATEGDLSQQRALLVNQDYLSEIARSLHLQNFIHAQDVPDNPVEESDAVLSDVVEALIGATYLDGGLEAAERLVRQILPLPVPDNINSLAAENGTSNFKGQLIEYCHDQGYDPPEFRTVDATGPDHARIYTVEVVVNGQIAGQGSGTSKKKAGQYAAESALAQMTT